MACIQRSRKGLATGLKDRLYSSRCSGIANAPRLVCSNRLQAIAADQNPEYERYLRPTKRDVIVAAAPAAQHLTNRPVRKGSPTEDLERLVNRSKSRVRALLEHVFAVVKRLSGFVKARYCGLANIFLARKRLVA